MNGPAIIPWLRKNDRISVLSRASIVRTVRTPARRNAGADRRQQPRADADLPRLRLDVDREHPAAGRRTEFPVAHFADDEADDAPAGLRDQELPAGLGGRAVALVDATPVRPLLEAGHRRVEGDDGIEVAAPHCANRDRRRGIGGRRAPAPAAASFASPPASRPSTSPKD